MNGLRTNPKTKHNQVKYCDGTYVRACVRDKHINVNHHKSTHIHASFRRVLLRERATAGQIQEHHAIFQGPVHPRRSDQQPHGRVRIHTRVLVLPCLVLYIHTFIHTSFSVDASPPRLVHPYIHSSTPDPTPTHRPHSIQRPGRRHRHRRLRVQRGGGPDVHQPRLHQNAHAQDGTRGGAAGLGVRLWAVGLGRGGML